MKLLWIVNTIFPAPSKAIGQKIPVAGGWMYGLASQISNCDGIELAVATTYAGSSLKKMKINGIQYYLLPTHNSTKYDSNLESYWVGITEHFRPDIIHIHGTEFAHGLACMRKMPYLNYVISIQGLVSIIEGIIMLA